MLGLTQRENLPEKDAVWPHIAQRGVQIMENTFWCHPLQGQEGLKQHTHKDYQSADINAYSNPDSAFAMALSLTLPLEM